MEALVTKPHKQWESHRGKGAGQSHQSHGASREGEGRRCWSLGLGETKALKTVQFMCVELLGEGA